MLIAFPTFLQNTGWISKSIFNPSPNAISILESAIVIEDHCSYRDQFEDDINYENGILQNYIYYKMLS